MRRLLLLLEMVLVALSLTAGPVNQIKAKKIVYAFSSTHFNDAEARYIDVVYTHPMPEKREAAFYIANIDNEGFVIVSAQDIAHPVLGYSFEHPWPTDALPAQITVFFDDLAAQIEASSSQEPDPEIATEWAQWLSDYPPTVDNRNENTVNPLLTTTWDQGMYYNNLCPEDANGPGGHVQSGCVAVAMAQIIKYWSYPQHGRGTHSYETNYGTLTVDYATETYNYNDMPNALSSESSPEQMVAVAQLIKDCGVSVNTNFTTVESGAYGPEVRAGLINYFQFSPNLSIAEELYFTPTDWHQILKDNLNANQPVYYSGEGTGNHGFVCDGYNTNNYFHFNFGWGGQADGWFLTYAINPGSNQYNTSQIAIVGISPDSTGNVILGHSKGHSIFEFDEPVDYYDLFGHNLYTASNRHINCQSTATFHSNVNLHLIVDAISIHGFINVHDGPDNNSMNIGQFYEYLLNHLPEFYPIETSSSWVTLSDYGNYSCNKGFHIHVQKKGSCRLVSHIETHADISSISLAWQEHGTSDSWEVEYGPTGFTQGTGDTFTTSTNAVCIDNLVFDKYYDFYIRPNCGANTSYMWKKTKARPDKPYWHERITSRPSTYVTDSSGDIFLYSPEALAWFNAVANGYDDGIRHHFNDTTVYLMADCDLGQYKWMPIHYFGGNFDGRNHIISNMYINEDRRVELTQNMYSVGMFRVVRNQGTIQDLTLYNSFVTGGGGVGALIGSLQPMDQSYTTPDDEDGATLTNVHSIAANVSGMHWVGGLVGDASYVNETHGLHTYNCSSSGIVSGAEYIGGLIGNMEYSECNNSFSTATIQLKYQENGTFDRGGLVGNAINSNHIHNCYASGEVFYIPNPMFYSEFGKVAGVIMEADPNTTDISTVSHLYGFDNNPSLSIYTCFYEPFPIVSDTSVFSQNGEHFHLNPAVTVNQHQYTDLLEALNAWVDDNNPDDLYLHWVADTAMLYGGFPMLERIETHNTYLVTASAQPQTSGTITGAGAYDEGSIATVTATPNGSYVFLNWTENNEEVSTDATFTFTVTSNRQLVAHFTDLSDTNEQNESTVSVYPNPAHDKLYIESPQRILVCELFTTVGSRVYHRSDNGTKIEIPLESLPDGLYLVRITTQDRVVTKRFIKE